MSAARAALIDWSRALWRGRYVVAYIALAASFVSHLRVFYHPPTGFTSLIWFGNWFAQWRLTRLVELPIYTVDHDGYDGQFYAQIAVDGNPFDPELQTALDAPGYRPRRLLVPMLANAAGLGRPMAVLTCYAFANVLAWLVLAYSLARWWFPPRDLHNLIRWSGTLFGLGMIMSVARSLTDGPALLLVACAVRAAERRRHLLAAVVMAAAGLTRELSVLAAAGILPERGETGRRWWLRAAGLTAICVLPAALWVLWLRVHFGYFGGENALTLPLAGVVAKVRELRDTWGAAPAHVAQEICVMIALATQVGFILARPRPRERWWRMAAPFAVLALFFSPLTWRGPLSGGPRMVLPLTLAFNLLVPRTRAGLALLVAGNLTVVSVVDAFHPLRETRDGAFAGGITATYGGNWHEQEIFKDDHWRWVAGPTELRLRNSATTDRVVTVAFGLSCVTARSVTISVADTARRFALRPGAPIPVRLAPVVLHPGTTIIRFTTDAPPWREAGPRGRALSFSVHDLSVQ